ncbi:MAG: ornithine cyclodeaminase [Rhodobacteraceae bacterium]|nr:ornithine cyclodeaminase [Paracoccaceae bacterium]
MTHTISYADADPLLDWQELMDALRDGHDGASVRVGDVFLNRSTGTMLTRVAWIDGMGRLAKIANVAPAARQKQASINGAALLFSDAAGTLEAIIDFHLITKWKTAADSLLGASLLARTNSENILIVGAGSVARSLIEGYSSVFPAARISLWNRTTANARSLAAVMGGVVRIAVVTDLEAAVRSADIISTATLSAVPIIDGDWLAPGTHLDLIGAFRADMRETNDAAFRRSSIFVDARETTLDHIGELIDPIANGTIAPSDVIADYSDIQSGTFTRRHPDEITLFKNGGGAHLDLMTARYILGKYREKGPLSG